MTYMSLSALLNGWPLSCGNTYILSKIPRLFKSVLGLTTAVSMILVCKIRRARRSFSRLIPISESLKQ